MSAPRKKKMGETRVDLLHLLEDLRDAYPGALEETMLTEIMANALDSGASLISFQSDPAQYTLTVVDDGSGMQRRELARYHDIAASSKRRGEGIGFAGVGIKLGLLVSREVITETRHGATHVATRWHLASRHRAPWKWVPPSGLVTERGTAVTLKLTNPLSPLLDAGFMELIWDALQAMARTGSYELRVGGQTQSITVQPKANVPSYEIQPTDMARSRPADNRDGMSSATGKRVWNVLGF